jgi:hypothetical protein
MTVADILNRLLAASGLTATEVARRAHMGSGGPQQLQKLLDGRNNNPTYWTLKTIVEAMGGELVIRPADRPEAEPITPAKPRLGRPPRWANPGPGSEGETEIPSDAT